MISLMFTTCARSRQIISSGEGPCHVFGERKKEKEEEREILGAAISEPKDFESSLLAARVCNLTPVVVCPSQLMWG